MTKDVNRLKVVLAETKRTNRWLAEQQGKDEATVSKWCTTPASQVLEPYSKLLNAPMFRFKNLLEKKYDSE